MVYLIKLWQRIIPIPALWLGYIVLILVGVLLGCLILVSYAIAEAPVWPYRAFYGKGDTKVAGKQ